MTSKPVRSLLHRLRKDDPLLLEARVSFRDKMQEDSACTVGRDREGKPLRFVIRVRNTEPRLMELELCRQWAHALEWHDGGRDVITHDATWQNTFGRLCAAHIYGL